MRDYSKRWGNLATSKWHSSKLISCSHWHFNREAKKTRFDEALWLNKMSEYWGNNVCRVFCVPSSNTDMGLMEATLLFPLWQCIYHCLHITWDLMSTASSCCPANPPQVREGSGTTSCSIVAFPMKADQNRNPIHSWKWMSTMWTTWEMRKWLWYSSYLNDKWCEPQKLCLVIFIGSMKWKITLLMRP